LIDPLSAFISSLASSGSFDSALSAAKEATETTRKLDALVGRAAYVDQERLLNEGAPDAGAWGVQQILQGIQQGLSL
jgi:dihydroxyacetone kinase